MQPYSHVAVIGIDGMGAFNRLAPTPCMDRIFADGAVTFDGRSMDPTISAENWGGMLLGADPAVHDLTNGYISCHSYQNDALPSVFRRIREAAPEAYLASVVNWEPINIGIVEDGLGVDKRTAENDTLVTAQILDCVRHAPRFLFVQLDEVDGAGHHFGYGTEGHLKKITEIDALVGQIHDAYAQRGIIEDTLFLCIADHGGANHGHGGWTDTEKTIFFGAAGRGVQRGQIPRVVTKDIAAIVLYALGMEIPPYTPGGFTAQVPQGLFADAPADYRIEPEPSPVLPQATPPYDGPGGLRERFGGRLQLCMFFDHDLRDETARCRIREQGSVKFYANGVRGADAEFGATGAFTAEGLDLRAPFTILLWLWAEADLPAPLCVLGNKSPAHGRHQEKGFNLLLRNHSIMVQYGCGDDDADTVTAFGADGFSGWVHVALSVAPETGETICYLNFGQAHASRIEKKYMDSLAQGGPFTVGDDVPGSFNRSRGMTFRMDDLLVLRGAFTPADAAALKDYYQTSNSQEETHGAF